MTAAASSVKPLQIEYDPITGIPPEYNNVLPKDSDEYKRWKAAQEAGPEGQLAQLSLDKDGDEIEKKLPGGKVKKKKRPEIILERNTRNKRKCITTVTGLETFGIKLADASKLFGKKFASGAAITKSPLETEQIDIQGDCLDNLPEYILKTWGKDKGVKKGDIYFIDNKKKLAFFDEESSDEE